MLDSLAFVEYLNDGSSTDAQNRLPILQKNKESVSDRRFSNIRAFLVLFGATVL